MKKSLKILFNWAYCLFTKKHLIITHEKYFFNNKISKIISMILAIGFVVGVLGHLVNNLFFI